MDLLAAIRCNALQDVLDEKSSADYKIRRIHRWYSKNFYTPLHIAEELPLLYVLQHYYESIYESRLDEDDMEALEDERVLLTETEEQRRDRLRKEEMVEMDDDDFYKAAVAEEEAKEARKKREAPEATLGGDEAEPSFQVRETGEATLGEVIQDGKLPPDMSFSFDTSDLGEDEEGE